MRAIAIDFETANEDYFSPCAIGLAWIENLKVTRREYRLIRPKDMRFNAGNIRIHGIHPADVQSAGEFPDVIREFLPEISGNVLLAHNANFDVNVLCATLAVYGIPVPRFTFLCTVLVSRRSWPQAEKYKLSEMARLVGVRFQHHHAGEDAFACAQIAVAAAGKSEAAGISDLASKIMLRHGRADSVGYLSCESCSTQKQYDAPAGVRYSKLHSEFVNIVRTRQEQEGVRFLVRGSTGNLYDVTSTRKEGRLFLRCSCMAGQNRRRCRHITALLDGDVTDLLSGNLADIEQLAVLQKTGKLDLNHLR